MVLIRSASFSWRNKTNEPAHDKTYNKTCVTCEDSDQPANLHSLIRVFADHICLLQSPGYPKRDKREALPYQYWNRYAFANSIDPDQMPQNVASDQGLHCLPYIQLYFRHIKR